MKSRSKRLAVLSFFLLLLLPLAVGAAPAPGVTESPAVVAHLDRTEGADARTHVHVELTRGDVTDVTVELFDAEGASVHTYTLDPWQDDTYRPAMVVELAPVLAARVQTARVTAFTIATGKREALFETGLIPAQVNPCANQCTYTRRDCSNDCFLANCTGAIYSCTGTPGNCVASCTCTGC